MKVDYPFKQHIEMIELTVFMYVDWNCSLGKYFSQEDKGHETQSDYKKIYFCHSVNEKSKIIWTDHKIEYFKLPTNTH